MIKASLKYIILIIVVSLLSLFIFVSTTNLGARFVFGVASHIVPGKLNFQSISGAFNRTITIKLISYNNSTIAITANNVQFHLQPLALLLNELRVNTLTAKKLKIQLLNAKGTSSTERTPQFSLPIKLRLSNIHLQTLDLIKEKQTYQLQNFNLDSFIKSNTIDITTLQSDYQNINYKMKGEIELQPINVNLQLTVRQKQTKLLAMKINGNGSWKNLVIKANTDIPAKVQATLTLHNIFDNLSWQLIGSLQDFSAQQYIKMIAYQHITGNFNGNGTMKKANFSANIFPDMNATSNIKLRFSSKNLTNQQFNAQLIWQNLSLTNLTIQDATSSQGKIEAQGTLNNYHINSDMSFSGKKIPTGHLKLSGSGNLKQIHINNIAIKMLNGHILGKANLKWTPNLYYQGQFTSQHLEPQQKWADWPGDITFTVKATGSPQEDRIELSDLHGSLRKQSLTGHASLQLQHNHIEQAISNIRLGKAKIDINLKRTDHLQAIWNIEIPDLAKATPFGNGELNTSGQLNITHALPIISGHITGKNLAWLNYQVGTLNSQFTLNLNSLTPSHIQLTASELKLSNYSFTKLTFNGNGNEKQQHLNLTINAKNQNLNIKTISKYKNKQWQFRFSQFSLSSAQHSTWRLKNPFELIYTHNSLELKNFSWQANTQTINANFIWNEKKLTKAQLNFHQVALSLFDLFIPNNIRLQGKINGVAQYNWDKNNNSNANIQANIAQAEIQYLMQGKKQTFILQNGQLQASLKKQKLSAQLKLKLLSEDYLNIMLTADPFKLTNNLIHTQISQGSLTAHLTKLNFISLFFPQLQEINGVANINLAWHGTLIKPHLTGSANLKQTTATLAAQGLHLKNIQLQATAENNKVNYQVQTTSGKGTLTVNGTSYLDNQYKTTLELLGNDITVINTPQYQITVSPKLNLVIDNKRIDLTGDISLPSIYIDQTNYANVVRLPSEVTITDTQQDNNTISILDKLHARIKLVLGKNIQFKNDHLDVQLAGALVLIDNPRTTTRANGELTITKGNFTIFGQTLNIENGKLIYVGGPTTNPGLNIKATKTIHTFVSPTQNSLTQTSLSPSKSSPSQQINIPLQQKTIVVGVSVTNTLNNPHITLFSDEPGLSQTDILSYLILGYPTDNASNQQAQALLRALDALNANNSNASGIIDRFKQTLSLDQIGLQSDSYLNSKTNTVEQNTSLVLGKMLSPKLFVRYSIGLIEPINTLSTAYQFNQHWTAQTQSNSLGNGIDLTYSWEQN